MAIFAPQDRITANGVDDDDPLIPPPRPSRPVRGADLSDNHLGRLVGQLKAEPERWDPVVFELLGGRILVMSDRDGEIEFSFQSHELPVFGFGFKMTARQAWVLSEKLGRLAQHQGQGQYQATGKKSEWR